MTLADRKKWQSIGHMDVCPRTGLPFIVANGFRHVDDKSNQLCSADMEAQSMLFFGKKQLHFANSIVTDVGVFGVASELIKKIPIRHRTAQKQVHDAPNKQGSQPCHTTTS